MQLIPVFVYLDSPADSSDLQVNDEILEVNGMLVTEATHADVIMQIHKVIT